MNRTNHTKGERATKEIVVGKCWEYFYQNFYKFSQANKIKISLALCTKDMPTQLDGDIGGKDTRIVIVSPKERQECGNRVSALVI